MTEKISAVVADDEPLARVRLIKLLRDLEINVVAEASNGSEALKLLTTLQPDVVFLDIQMPGLGGLETAEAALETAEPQIVFLTAHSEFAAQAFALDACDYVLKPATLLRLEKTVQRLRRRIGLDTATSSNAANNFRLPVPSRNGVVFFAPEQCDRFSAEEKYVLLKILGEEHLLREPLDALEDTLAPYGFLRVHRKELVRQNAIVALEADEQGWCLKMQGGDVVRVSRRRLVEVRAALGLR